MLHRGSVSAPWPGGWPWTSFDKALITSNHMVEKETPTWRAPRARPRAGSFKLGGAAQSSPQAGRHFGRRLFAVEETRRPAAYSETLEGHATFGLVGWYALRCLRLFWLLHPRSEQPPDNPCTSVVVNFGDSVGNDQTPNLGMEPQIRREYRTHRRDDPNSGAPSTAGSCVDWKVTWDLTLSPESSAGCFPETQEELPSPEVEIAVEPDAAYSVLLIISRLPSIFSV